MSNGQYVWNSGDKCWRSWYGWPQNGDCEDDHGKDEADEVIDTETEHQAGK